MAKAWMAGMMLTALIASGASAETVRGEDALPPAAQQATAPAPGQDAAQPAPARPRVKKKNSFFGLPLLGLAAAGGTAGALASSGGNTNGAGTASPQ